MIKFIISLITLSTALGGFLFLHTLNSFTSEMLQLHFSMLGTWNDFATSQNTLLFDPLGQFEVLNFYTVYANMFNNFTNIVPDSSLIQSILYNTQQYFSFFKLIPELTNIVKIQDVNIHDFLTNELWLKLSSYNNIFYTDKLKQDHNITYKPDLFINSNEFITFFNNFIFQLSLVDFLFKNVTNIENISQFLNFYAERNTVDINYASYLLEVNNISLFFSLNKLDPNVSSTFLTKLGVNMGDYTAILFAGDDNENISEQEAFFSIGTYIYSKYVTEYYKSLEYLWKTFTYYHNAKYYRHEYHAFAPYKVIDKDYRITKASNLPNIDPKFANILTDLNHVINHEANINNLIQTFNILYNYTFNFEIFSKFKNMGLIFEPFGSYLTYNAGNMREDAIVPAYYPYLYKNRLYDILVMESYKWLDYYTYNNSIFNDPMFTVITKDINYNLTKFFQNENVHKFIPFIDGNETTYTLYTSPSFGIENYRANLLLYELLFTMKKYNSEDFKILELFENYYLSDKRSTQGSTKFLPIDSLLITKPSDFYKWTLSIAKHCHLDTNISSDLARDQNFIDFKTKRATNIFNTHVNQTIFIYDYATNMCINTLKPFYLKNDIDSNMPYTNLWLSFITYLTKGVIFNPYCTELEYGANIWLEKQTLNNIKIQNHLLELKDFINDYKKNNEGHDLFFPTLQDMISFFLTVSASEGPSMDLFNNVLNVKQDFVIFRAIIYCLKDIWDILAEDMLIYDSRNEIRPIELTADKLFTDIVTQYVTKDKRLIGWGDSLFGFIFSKIYALPEIAPVDLNATFAEILTKNSEKVNAETFLNIFVNKNQVIDEIINTHRNAIKNNDYSNFDITVDANKFNYSYYDANSSFKNLSKQCLELLKLDLVKLSNAWVNFNQSNYLLSNTPLNIMAYTFIDDFNILTFFFDFIQIVFLQNQNTIISYILLVSILLFFIIPLIKNITLIPNNWQIVFESLYKFIINILEAQVGKIAQRFFPYVFSVFIIILIANIAGMTLYSFTLTSHILVTFTLGVSSFLGLTILGFFLQKFGFFNLFIPKGIPSALVPILLVVEIISYVSRALSLSIRLFANLMSGHTLLHILAFFSSKLFKYKYLIGFLSFLLILAIVVLEFCIAILQAYVFTILICIYLNDSFNASH